MILRLEYFPTLLLLMVWTPAAAQDIAAEETLRELELYEGDLHRFESEGIYHGPGLVEPLSRIADRYMELGRFTEADAALDRAQQIVRISEGLYTSNQLPFLNRKILNYANSGNWREARKLQDHVRWLYRKKITNPDESTISGLQDLAALHIRGASEDESEQRHFHYRRALSSNERALYIAEEILPPRDQRISGLLYDQVRFTYMQAAARAAEGVHPGPSNCRKKENGSFISECFEPAVVRRARESGAAYLERLQQFHADENPEAFAMAKLYLADWLLWFDQKAEALELYQESFRLLVKSGVAEEAISKFLDLPVLLPEPEFYPAVEQALEAHSIIPANVVAGFIDGFPIRVAFHDPRPIVDLPLTGNSGEEGNPDWRLAALFSFELPGADDVSVRPGRQRRNSLGIVQNPRLIELLDNSLEQEAEEVLANMDLLRFRPGLSEGRPHAASGRISFLVPGEN